MTITDYFDCSERPGFLAWGTAVNASIEAQIGVSLLDLPDEDYSSMYEDGMEPDEAAAEVIANNHY